MSKNRVSKWDLFQTALDVLRHEGAAAVRVERLDRDLRASGEARSAKPEAAP